MTTKLKTFIQPFLKKDLPDINPGDIIRIYQKIKREKKEKTQVFEGVVIARRHGKEIGATITVRKVIEGIGVEKIFPIHLPTIEKIEVLKRRKARRAKLYYLRKAKRKKTRLKKRFFDEDEESVGVLTEKKNVGKKRAEEKTDKNKNKEEIKKEK